MIGINTHNDSSLRCFFPETERNHTRNTVEGDFKECEIQAFLIVNNKQMFTLLFYSHGVIVVLLCVPTSAFIGVSWCLPALMTCFLVRCL